MVILLLQFVLRFSICCTTKTNRRTNGEIFAARKSYYLCVSCSWIAFFFLAYTELDRLGHLKDNITTTMIIIESYGWLVSFNEMFYVYCTSTMAFRLVGPFSVYFYFSRRKVCGKTKNVNDFHFTATAMATHTSIQDDTSGPVELWYSFFPWNFSDWIASFRIIYALHAIPHFRHIDTEWVCRQVVKHHTEHLQSKEMPSNAKFTCQQLIRRVVQVVHSRTHPMIIIIINNLLRSARRPSLWKIFQMLLNRRRCRAVIVVCLSDCFLPHPIVPFACVMWNHSRKRLVLVLRRLERLVACLRRHIFQR